MNCIKCNAENGLLETLCKKCGAPLPEEKKYQINSSRNSGLNGWTIFGIIAVLLKIIILIIKLSR